MADLSVEVTIETVTELADGSGYNIAATAPGGVALLITSPSEMFPEGSVLQVDVTLIP